MESISDLLKDKVFEKRKKGEREPNEVLDGFMQMLNPPRIEKGYKPLSYSRIAFLISHLDNWDKHMFLGSCKGANNPSAFFWSALKPKK